MTVTAASLGINKLGVEERLALVEEIWASICADAQRFPLSGSQLAELERRIADDDEFPEDVVPWNEVKSSVQARLGRWAFASFSGRLQEPSSKTLRPGMRASVVDSARCSLPRSCTRDRCG